MDKLLEEFFTFKSTDQTEVFVYKWVRREKELKGIVQIAHGMAETAARYKRFARALTNQGFIVYANDHRGHGCTAENINNLGYLGDEDGFELVVEDMVELTDIIKEKNPNLPLYLFSHSMGSFAAQRYIMDYDDRIDGLILSGSNGEQGKVLKVGRALAKLEMLIRGKKAKSKMMNTLTFGSYNKSFQPKKTGYEWLTRDEEELDKYMKDPYCGGMFPTSFYYEFLDTLEYIEDEENLSKIPQDLPILIISGDQDPVGDFGEGVTKLKERYENQGVKDLKMKLYEGARHELLNEMNREEVTEDILNWLKEKVANKCRIF